MSIHVASWAWVQVVGDPEAKLVLLKLADQANDEGICWPSQRSIAEACETSVSTVKRRVTYLVERKLLFVEERRNERTGMRTSNFYILPFRRQFTSEPSGGDSELTVSSPTDLTVSSRRVNQHESLLEPSLNHQDDSSRYRHYERDRLECEAEDAKAEILTAEENAERLRKLRSELDL